MAKIESQDSTEDWITTAQAARKIGITPRWVRDLIDRKKLVGWRITSRFLMVSRQSVEDYLREKK